MPQKTYAARCQVYRYFNVETGECISAYYARRLPRGKVRVEVLNLAVRSKSPMEIRRSMSLPLPFRMLAGMGQKLSDLLTWSKTHLNPFMAKQKEAIFQQAAEMAQKIPVSVRHYPGRKGLFGRSHARPVTLSRETVKNNTSLVAEIQ